MMNQEVREIMNANPETAGPEQDVAELSLQMLSKGLQQMPVVESGKLLGMVTTYDLWKRYENMTTLAGLKVRDVMNTKVIKISPKDKVGTAAELFADKRFKTLPIVNTENELKGTITAFDIIKVVFNAEYDNKILFKKEFEQ